MLRESIERGSNQFLTGEAVMTGDDWPKQQAEWENPGNWRLSLYYAPRDSRVWVRKRNPTFGWTLNFAHRQSWFWLAVLVGLPVLLIIWRVLTLSGGVA
jgi:uncharacterized protein DUF5808